MVDSCIQTDIEVSFDDLPSDIAYGIEADARIVKALGIGITIFGETEGPPILVKEILLFKAEPRSGVIRDGRASVGRVGRSVGHQNFAHYEDAIDASGVRVNGDGFEHAVRALAFGLAGGASVKAPKRKIFQFWELGKFLDLSFATEVGDGLVAVEPDIFEFVLGQIGRCYWFFWSRLR